MREHMYNFILIAITPKASKRGKKKRSRRRA